MEKTKTKIKNPRAFSLEDEFMKYDTDDLLYGFMRALSTVRPPKDEDDAYLEYLPIKVFDRYKSKIASIVGVTTRTIKNHLERLESKGLIGKCDEEINGKMVKCFWVPKVEGRYEIIEQDMVRYLLDTTSVNGIKIYIYLLNKYKWKRQTNEKYIFTKRELLDALGYSKSSESSELYDTINNILMMLVNSELVEYRIVKCEIENSDRYKTTERMELSYVVEKFDEVKTLYKNKVEI